MRAVERRVSIIIAGACLAALSAQALAETAEKPTVEGQLCSLAGICGGEANQSEVTLATREAPATKGFRLARSAPAPVSEPAPNTKGFRIAKPAGAGQAEGFRIAKPVRPAQQTVRRATPGVRTAMVTTAAPTRVQTAAIASTTRKANLSITFESGSDRITAEGIESARVFQQTMMAPQLRGKRFLIEGHTDATGNSSKNLELSRRRAQAVADFLISQDVEASRIEVKGAGSNEPLPGRRRNDPANRRVEAQLIS